MMNRVSNIEVTLPGGMVIDDSLERRARFRVFTGRVEQAIVDMATMEKRPDYVTSLLTATMDSIGNCPIDAKIVADLCVADRHFLLLRLTELLHGNQLWLEVDCCACGEKFDVDVKRSELPIEAAGHDFPYASLKLHDQLLKLRVPTGRDQEAIAGYPEKDALRMLLERCICSVDGVSPEQGFISALDSDDIEKIDAALNEASPTVCNQLLVICPECQQEQRAEMDHSSLVYLSRRHLFDEVHTLASNYHWSESAILDLPQDRRRLYISLINNSPNSTMQGGVP